MNKRKLVILLLVGLWLPGAVTAQRYLDYREADQRPWHYGFILGINSYTFTVTPSMAYIDAMHGVLGAQVSSSSPGFTVGILGDVRLGQYFNLRLTPTLNFTNRSISYQNLTANTRMDDQTITSAIIEVPLYLKYRSVWYGRTRPYLIAGGGINIDMVHDVQQPVLINSTDPFIGFGVGCDFYFDYFRLAPEIKFCIGLKNLLIPMSQRNSSSFTPEEIGYSDALSRLTSKMLVLTFNFE